MGNFNIIGDKGSMITRPLIHINCIIDEDLTMLSYIFNDIHNEEVFDFDYLDTFESHTDFIRAVYTRKCINPLELILKDKSNTEFAMSCYEELKASGEYLSSDLVYGTDVYELLDLFIQSDSVIPTIMYENEKELEIIQRDAIMSKVECCTVQKALNDINQHGQLYLRYVSDAELFRKIIGKTFYFSSSGINLTEDMTEPEYNDILYDLAHRKLNQINFFELYSVEMIGRTIN